MKVLVTCPPMLGMIKVFQPAFQQKNVELTAPNVVQTLSINELKELVPQHDGWIIGDDPASREVLQAGREGRLKAAVKWGIGVDNIDHEAIKEFGIRFSNTPQLFGREVADLAMAYVVALARETYLIDQSIKNGEWPKPKGMSLANRQLALIGFGDIGRNVARRALASDMNICAYDPAFTPDEKMPSVQSVDWPDRINEADFIVLTCALNPSNFHMLNETILNMVKPGVRIVNVARGGLIDEAALVEAQRKGKVHSVALDVFEMEPLPDQSPLRSFENNIFGSHNGSNTEDAVIRASHRAMELLFGHLGIQ